MRIEAGRFFWLVRTLGLGLKGLKLHRYMDLKQRDVSDIENNMDTSTQGRL